MRRSAVAVRLLAEISGALQRGEDERVERLTEEAIAAGVETRRILDEGLIAGMSVVGERFKSHEIFLPEVLLAARAMTAGMGRLKPLLIREGIPSLGKIVIGSVQGDLHDIGKNLVGIMLGGAGFEVIDLGNDVAPERFVEAAERHGAPVIGLSALLTTTMPVMRRVVDLARGTAGGGLKIIIGGAPVSADYAREIGADAYGYDAANAVDQVRRLIGASAAK
jgi:5-methyltetrahydrofolate--homocysteine methyltransferase